MRAVGASDRTVAAIRKADALPTVLPGGKFHKGIIYSEDTTGSSYPGMFAVTDASVGATYRVNVGAGYARINARWVSVAAQSNVAVPAAFVGAAPDYGFVTHEFNLDGSNVPQFDQCAILGEPTFAAGEADHAYLLMGRVRKTTGVAISIIQDQYGVAGGYDISGSCTGGA